MMITAEQQARKDGRIILDALRGGKTERLALGYGYGPGAFTKHVRKAQKPLSPRRARELRDRWLKKMFGSRKQRAERFAWLTRLYGKHTAVDLSRNKPRFAHGCSCPECAPQY